MGVIRHDSIAPEVIALAVEVMQTVSDDLGDALITQRTAAVVGVEILVELVGELTVVAGFSDVIPRRGIRGEEGLAGAKPVVEEFTRQRIGEAEGDEDHHLALLPVRELVVGLLDVPAWIEELHGTHLIEGSAGIASLRSPLEQPAAGYTRFAPVFAHFLKWRRRREEKRRTGVFALLCALRDMPNKFSQDSKRRVNPSNDFPHKTGSTL